MPAGHVAALVESKNEHVVLEVDEGWLAGTLAFDASSVVVLLNLSPRSLDRANEVRHLAERWRKPSRPTTTDKLVVVANAKRPARVYAADVRAKHRSGVTCHVVARRPLSCPQCTLAISHVGSVWHARAVREPVKVTSVLAGTCDRRRGAQT